MGEEKLTYVKKCFLSNFDGFTFGSRECREVNKSLLINQDDEGTGCRFFQKCFELAVLGELQIIRTYLTKREEEEQNL